jgi:hypothetical protein
LAASSTSTTTQPDHTNDIFGKHNAAADPDPAAYFRDLAKTCLDDAWQMMLDNDLAFSGVEGELTPMVRISNAYGALVQKAATTVERVADAFLRVIGLVDPPTALLRPKTLLRVLAEEPREHMISPNREGSTT